MSPRNYAVRPVTAKPLSSGYDRSWLLICAQRARDDGFLGFAAALVRLAGGAK